MSGAIPLLPLNACMTCTARAVPLPLPLPLPLLKSKTSSLIKQFGLTFSCIFRLESANCKTNKQTNTEKHRNCVVVMGANGSFPFA